MKMRKAKRTFINTPKANRVVGGFDFSHMGFALLHEEKIIIEESKSVTIFIQLFINLSFFILNLLNNQFLPAAKPRRKTNKSPGNYVDNFTFICICKDIISTPSVIYITCNYNFVIGVKVEDAITVPQNQVLQIKTSLSSYILPSLLYSLFNHTNRDSLKK